MADVVITVRGSHDSAAPPERATARVDVALEGPAKDEVFAGTSQTAASVASQIAPLFDREQGPVTWWSSDQLRTWANRPWNQDGKQLPLVHHAAVSFQVKFKDFDALSRWLGAVGTMTGVTISGIEWALTEARRLALTEQSRTAAVHDARDKAQTYARSLGLGSVRVIAIADVGMLGDQSAVAQPKATAFAARAAKHGGPGDAGLEFAPQDITINAAVDARFVADQPA